MQSILTPEETIQSEEAIAYLNENKKKLVERYIDSAFYVKTADTTPTSIYTAGWPGVGKTEYAKNFIRNAQDTYDINFLHIDIDEYRKFFPIYNGKNASVVQHAATKAVHIIFNHAHKNKLNYILDTTFAADTTLNSLERDLDVGRQVFIDFIYLDPRFAWINAKAREKVEGRYVPKEVFIQKYFNSISNVKRIKETYQDRISLSVVIKGTALRPFALSLEKYALDVANVETFLPKIYTTVSELNKALEVYEIL